MFSRTRSMLSTYGEVGLCYFMHTFLVIIFAAMLVVAAYHWEHGFNRPFTTTGQTTMTTITTVVAQTFSTLYLAALVVVTQQLALVRDLRTPQTLTAVHDKASAWLGLGSSVAVILDQVDVRAAVPGVVFVTLYLAGVAALHVTIPASIEVNTYNAVEVVKRETQLARPHDVAGDTAWDILRTYNQLPQTGLHDNMIYDVIPVEPMAVEGSDVLVNATAVEVSCGPIANARQSGFLYSEDGWTLTWTVDLGRGTHLELQNPIPYSLRTSSTLINSTLPPTVVPLISTLPIVDDAGDRGALLNISPGVLAEMGQSGPNDTDNRWMNPKNITVDSLHILACNIITVDRLIRVSASTRQPVDTPSLPKEVLWKNWSLPSVPGDPLLQNISLHNSPVQDSIGGIAYWDPTNSLAGEALLFPEHGRPSSSNISWLGAMPIPPVSLVDQFIMEDLMKEPGAWPPQTQSVLLSDLQASLGKLYAAMIWYYRNGNHSTAFSYDSDWVANQDRIGQAEFTVNTLRMHLNFNILFLSMSLAVSCLLLALTNAFVLPLPLHNQGVSKELNTAGILQITWLLGNIGYLSGIARPTQRTLREAGMFDIQLSSCVQEKMARSAENGEASGVAGLEDEKAY